MSLLVFASAKGAPGVTAAVTALAHVWPAGRDPLVVELDPSGGDLTVRLGLDASPGLATLAAQTHRSGGPVDVRTHSQDVRGLQVVPAPSGRAAGRAATLLGPALADALIQLAEDGDVLVDAGRLDGTGADGPGGTLVLRRAHLVAVLCRTGAADLAHAVAAVAELNDGGSRAGMVLVGGEHDIAVATRSVPVPVHGCLPDDPRGAAVFSGAPVRPWLLERLPLVRAARVLAAAIAAVVDDATRKPAPSVSASLAPAGHNVGGMQ